MRILLAFAVLAGGVVALDTPADAARKRTAKQPYKSSYAAKPRYQYQDYREQVECERARNEDPTGEFASYPCWARETFARGRRGGGDRYD
jgi:hypothetical protein